MALFAISDLHLSFSVNKPMDIFGDRWENHAQRLRENWLHVVSEGDTVVLPGDFSWGMTMDEALMDFRFVDELPGRKLLLKGNHDYWWATATKAERFFVDNGIRTLSILHNNAYRVGDYAVCGSKGWLPDPQESPEHNRKITEREAGRLRLSLEAGRKLGGEPLVFLHYPPKMRDYECQPITDVIKEFGVRRVYFGHVHGEGCEYAFVGEEDGVTYTLISSDYVNFLPIAIE